MEKKGWRKGREKDKKEKLGELTNIWRKKERAKWGKGGKERK